MLEPVEGTLNQVPALLDLTVILLGILTVRLGRYDRDGSLGVDEPQDFVAVISLVGNHVGGLDSCQQGYSLWGIMSLTSSEGKTYGLALGINHQMNLGAQSSSGTPQSLALAPPFPQAACWWARTMVESIMM